MIHIACNIDANFTRHCAVTLVSLFVNNPSETFCVHIVAPGLPEKDQEILRTLAAGHGNEVRFYFPSDDLLSAFSIKEFGRRISMATYYRCMFSAILPEEVEKVLYLDCDIVVTGGISDFWNTDLSGLAVACVEDIGSGAKERYEVLKYDACHSYFNAGVLLINLAWWREHQVDRLCVDYFRTYPERIRFNDQDLLNALLHEHKLFVPLKWNMQDGFYRYGAQRKTADEAAWMEELRHPAILHYTNRKPWCYDSQHPLRDEYYRYLDLTPWKGWRCLASPVNRLKRWLRFLPYTCGWRKPKYIRLG